MNMSKWDYCVAAVAGTASGLILAHAVARVWHNVPFYYAVLRSWL